jgi:hypothetical protein
VGLAGGRDARAVRGAGCGRDAGGAGCGWGVACVRDTGGAGCGRDALDAAGTRPAERAPAGCVDGYVRIIIVVEIYLIIICSSC